MDSIDEVELIRIMIERLTKEISFKEVSYTDDNENELRNDHYLQQLNTLANMATARGNLIRTQYLIKGKSEGVQNSILEALEIVRIELGIA